MSPARRGGGSRPAKGVTWRLAFRVERAIWRFSQTEAGRATVVCAALLALGFATAAFWALATYLVSRAPEAATVAGFATIAAAACALTAVLVDGGEGGQR